MNDENTKFMNNALDEALKAHYHNWKDPLVGCVIVKDGEIIAAGHQKAYGKDHAVVNAMNGMTADQLEGSSLYTTMMPCDRCADLIFNNKIKSVIVGQNISQPSFDNEKMVEKLEKHGVEVKTNVLNEKVKKLNEFYNYFYENNRPWITVKQSLSLDHHVGPANGKHPRINSPKVYDHVHHERADYQALIIGSSTAIIDNPNMLTDVDSEYQPIRIVIDGRGRLLNHLGLNLLNNTEVETWVFTQNSNLAKTKFNGNVRVFEVNTHDVDEIMQILTAEEIQSVYVEGGPTVQKAFMDKGYVNRIIDYFAPLYFGEIGLQGAVPTHEFELKNVDVSMIDDNIRVCGDVE